MCRAGKSISRVSVSEERSATLPQSKWFKVINPPSGSWPITSGSGAIEGLSVGLWQTGHSAVARPAWVSGHPGYDPLRDLHSCCFDPLGVAEVAEKRAWLVATEWVMPSIWLFKFSAQVTLWWALTWGINIFTFFAYSEKSIIYLFPRPHCYQFSSGVPDHPRKPFFHSSWIDVESYLWPFLIPGKMHSQVHCSKFCPLGGFPFSSFSGLFQKGTVVLQHPLLDSEPSLHWIWGHKLLHSTTAHVFLIMKLLL